jgi:carbon storage regulator
MLILERKLGERVIINDDIVVTITGIDRSCRRIKLGFEAPEKYEIHREEIYDLIQQEKRR